MLGTNLRRRRSAFTQEDVNPMEGAINIVDAMLVFACGLMLSLVIFWNIDIQNQDLKPSDTGVEVITAGENGDGADSPDNVDENADYEMMGRVYVDPVTGKMYLVEEGGGNE